MFRADNIMTGTAFAVVWHNGKLARLNRNGQPERVLSDAVAAVHNVMFYWVCQKSDFHPSGHARRDIAVAPA